MSAENQSLGIDTKKSGTDKISWIVIWTTFIAGVIATFAQASVMPIMPVLQAQFSFSHAAGGLLVSVFALTTLLAAVPTGFTVRKYGVRNVGVCGLALILLGMVGCLFANSYALLLASRIIAGIGFGLISVAAPSAIGQYVSPRLLTIAMAIWCVWIPGGTLIMFLTGPRIYQYNNQLFWSLLVIVLFLVLIAYAKWIPNPKAAADPAEYAHLTKDIIKLELTNPGSWLLAITFTAFTFTFFSFNTWVSTYLVEVNHLSVVTAAWMPIVAMFFVCCSNIYGGMILQKYRNNILTFIIPPVLMALIWLTFVFGQGSMLPFAGSVVLGLVAGVIPSILFGGTPRMAKRKETIGIAMAILIIGENAGIIIGPAVSGFLRDYTGHFTVSFLVMFIVGLYNVYNCLMIQRTGIFK